MIKNKKLICGIILILTIVGIIFISEPIERYIKQNLGENICEKKCGLEGFFTGRCQYGGCMEEETNLESLRIDALLSVSVEEERRKIEIEKEYLEIDEGCGPYPRPWPPWRHILPCTWTCCCK